MTTFDEKNRERVISAYLARSAKPPTALPMGTRLTERNQRLPWKARIPRIAARWHAAALEAYSSLPEPLRLILLAVSAVSTLHLAVWLIVSVARTISFW
jgi:hypothetical protein